MKKQEKEISKKIWLFFDYDDNKKYFTDNDFIKNEEDDDKKNFPNVYIKKESDFPDDNDDVLIKQESVIEMDDGEVILYTSPKKWKR